MLMVLLNLFQRYCWRTFVYPAKRVRFDGGEIIALKSPETGDEDWLRYPEAM